MVNDLVSTEEKSLFINQEPIVRVLNFYNKEEQIGKLYWENELKFEGKAEESAYIFIDWLKELWGLNK